MVPSAVNVMTISTGIEIEYVSIRLIQLGYDPDIQ